MSNIPLRDFAFWPGNLVVNLLESANPGLRSEEDSLAGFNPDYLEQFNLNRKERFKYFFKEGVRINVSIFIWTYLLSLFIGIPNFLDWNFHRTLFVVLGFSFIMLSLTGILVAIFKSRIPA